MVRFEPTGPLLASVSCEVDLLVDAADAGAIHLVEEWLAPRMIDATLEPVLTYW